VRASRVLARNRRRDASGRLYQCHVTPC
jgi:hypothetical protein